jgi:hypothetical protein
VTDDLAPPRPPPQARSLPLAGRLGTPLAVAGLHLVVGYAIVSLHCQRGWFPGSVAGMPVVRATMLVVTVVSLAIIVGSIVATAKTHRALRSDRSSGVDPGGNREFLLFGALLIDGALVAYVIWALVLVVMVDPC